MCVPAHSEQVTDALIQEKRKTITGDNILFTMATLGFDNHIDPLRIYLQNNYREISSQVTDSIYLFTPFPLKII